MRPRRLFRPMVCLGMVIVAAGVPPAIALTVDRARTTDLVDRAELILLGTVVSVDYRNSHVAGPEHAALPHTFVTLQIEQALKGASQQGSQVTLRFQGGPDGRGRTLTIPGIPLFDVGDRELVFVEGNGRAMCPLVGWEQGRLRVVQGLAYTDDGREVWLTRDGGLAFGAQHALPEVLTSRIGDMEFHAEIGQSRALPAPPPGAVRLDEPGLAAAIRRLVQARFSTRALAELAPVPSARLDERFFVAAARPGPPPGARP